MSSFDDFMMKLTEQVFKGAFGVASHMYERRKEENAEFKYREDMRDAGSLGSLLGDVDIEDVFKAKETNGYVPNNNDYIEKKLKNFNPYFNSKEFINRAKELFYGINNARAMSELDPKLVPYVVKDFPFSANSKINIERFTVCYLNLYKKERDVEYIYACVGFLEEADQREVEPTRYFVKFKRPSQYKTVDYRNVKVTACPHCGGPVYFKNKDTEKCTYCGQYVNFTEHNWQVYELERINTDTVIENMTTI